jgi:predicted GIY-YIG superfamily endonuclease
MPDYSKSVIYLLRHKDDINLENIYIGSTNDFRRRKRKHKCNSNNPNIKEYNFKVYQYIRNNGGWDEWVMKIIEKYPCNLVEELKTKEDEIMLQYPNRLNEHRAKRSTKEYQEDNKEKLKEYYKEYNEDNKEKKKEKRKEKITCECGCIVTKGCLTRHKRTDKHLELTKQ